MTKKEFLLKQKNAQDIPLTDYLSTDGYLWQMIENAMEEYAQDKVKNLGLFDVSFSLLAKVEKELDSDLEKYWKHLIENAEYKKMRNIEPFMDGIQKIEARKFQIEQLRLRALENES